MRLHQRCQACRNCGRDIVLSANRDGEPTWFHVNGGTLCPPMEAFGDRAQPSAECSTCGGEGWGRPPKSAEEANRALREGWAEVLGTCPDCTSSGRPSRSASAPGPPVEGGDMPGGSTTGANDG